MRPHDQDTGVYRALKGKFEMQPEQMQRLEQKLRARIAAAPVQSPQDRHAAPDTGTPRRKPAIGQYWYTARILPLAVSLVIVCTGGYLMYRAFDQTKVPDVMQISSQELEEQTAPPRTETVLVSETAPDSPTTHTEALTTAATTPQETHAATSAHSTPQSTSPPEQTAMPHSQPAAPTAAPVTGTTARTEAPQTVFSEETDSRTNAPTESDLTSAPPRTSTLPVPLTTAPTTTKQEDVPDWGNACIVIPDVSARAGETVTIRVIAAQEIVCAGMQFSAKLAQTDFRLSDADISSGLTEILAALGEEPTLNVTDDAMYIVFGMARDVRIPAGTELLTLRLTLPMELQPGTVYPFVPTDSRVKIVAHEGEEIVTLPSACYLGSITVV